MEFHDDRFALFWTPFLKRQGSKTLQAIGLICPAPLGCAGELSLSMAGNTHTAALSDLHRYPTGCTGSQALAVYLWLIPRPVRPTICRVSWKTPSGKTYLDSVKLQPAQPRTVHVVDQTEANLIPATPHDELLGIEGICRTFYNGRLIADGLGVPVPTAATLRRATLPTAALAMAFAAAGGKFLHIEADADSHRPSLPKLFWWKLPDESRLLCSLQRTGSDTLLPPADYAYADWLALCSTSGNTGADAAATKEQIGWIAAHFDSPTFKTGSLDDFAEAIIKRDGARLPIVEGEATEVAIHRIAAQPEPIALVRQAADQLTAAEIVSTLTAVASGRPVSADETVTCARAYEQLFRCSEQAATAHKDEPRQKSVPCCQAKATIATEARELAGRLEAGALKAAARAFGSSRGKDGILLFNVASWKRGGLVRMSDADLPQGELELVDTSTGGRVLYHREGGSLEFIAPPVPACGYLFLEAQPVRQRGLPGPEADWNAKHLTLHFESYALQFHTAGGMCRWHDRARSMQWCSNEAEFPMGTFLYEMPGDQRLQDFARQMQGNSRDTVSGRASRGGEGLHDLGPIGGGVATVTPEIGPMRSRVIVEAACPQPKATGRKSGCPRRYRTTYTVYRGCRDLHVRIELLDKPATSAAEAGYGFFPFYGNEPYVLIDRIAQLIEPSSDFMKGTNTAHMTIGHGIRVELEHAGMNFYPLHTPLIGFGGPGPWRFSDGRDYENGMLYATLFANEGGKGYVTQAGDLKFDFVCRPTGNDEWDGGLARGGLEVFRPIVGTVVRGMAEPSARSLLQIEPDLVQLVAMKPASFGPGVVMRLWSADPDALTAELTLPFANRGDVLEICDVLERPTGKRIALDKQGKADVPVRPHGITTLWLGSKRSGK